MTIKWTTPRGSAVELELITSETISADGDKVKTPCYKLECRVLTAPKLCLHAPTIVTHPVAGLCLREIVCGRETLVPVTAEVADAVTAMVNEYRAEMDRRNAEWIKGVREYDAHTARMRRAGYCDDPNAG